MLCQTRRLEPLYPIHTLGSPNLAPGGQKLDLVTSLKRFFRYPVFLHLFWDARRRIFFWNLWYASFQVYFVATLRLLRPLERWYLFLVSDIYYWHDELGRKSSNRLCTVTSVFITGLAFMKFFFVIFWANHERIDFRIQIERYIHFLVLPG